MSLIFVKSSSGVLNTQIGMVPNHEGELSPVISIQEHQISLDPSRRMNAYLIKQTIQPHDSEGQRAVKGIFEQEASLEAQAKKRQEAINVFSVALRQNIEEIFDKVEGVPEIEGQSSTVSDPSSSLFFFKSEKNTVEGWLAREIGREVNGYTFPKTTSHNIYNIDGDIILTIETFDNKPDDAKKVRQAIVKTIADLNERNMDSILNQIKEAGLSGGPKPGD